MSKVFNMVGGGGGPAASIFVTGLSETDTVTATKGSKKLTGKWGQNVNPAYHNLPSGYTELEYIENNAGEYINTGITQSTANRFMAEYQKIGTTDLSTIFGVADNNMRFGPIMASPNNKSCCISDSSWATCNGVDEYGKNKADVYFSAGKAVRGTVNDVPINSFTVSATKTTGNMYMFVFNNKGTASGWNDKLRVYSGAMLLGDVYARNYVPCKRNSDGAIGMYDLCGSASPFDGTPFYGNSGTGTFTAGPEVPQYIGSHILSPIRDFGTWTVTATNGTNTDTQDVLVDVITEYVIEMSYKLYLYRDGDECEDVTGGWTANGYTRNGYTVYAGTKESDALKISLSSSSGSQMCILGTNIAIDFSGYSKCCIEYLVSATDTYNPTIAAKTTKAAESTALFAKYGSSNFTANVTKILEIDISSVNGSGYFEWYCTNVATHRIYRVWLE